MKTAIEFKSDGTSTLDLDTPAGPALETATYTLKGDAFTLTLLTATFGGQTKKSIGVAPETYGCVLEGDTLTLTQKGGARIRLTRTV